LIAIQQIAHRDVLDSARATIRGDKVNAAILDGAKEWTSSGKLSAAVRKKTGTGTSTFKSRVAELVEGGLLEKHGGGPTTEYRATGLI
jgi:hypothetical protein